MIISPYAYTVLYLKDSPKSFELKPIIKKYINQNILLILIK